MCEIPEPEVEWVRASSQEPYLVNIEVIPSFCLFSSGVWSSSTQREAGSSKAGFALPVPRGVTTDNPSPCVTWRSRELRAQAGHPCKDDVGSGWVTLHPTFSGLGRKTRKPSVV